MNSAAAAAQENAFELRNATVRFGDTVALQRVSLAIAEGERVGFVGPSGAGKTTLLRLLNASQLPTEGTAWLGGVSGESVRGDQLRALRSSIGLVPQRYHLVPSLRVLHNVLMGKLGKQGFLASMRSLLLPNQEEQEAVHALLEEVGIGEKLFAKTDTLSGGQQQRVAIARALYQRPRALLADEPVASVDPTRAEATMSLLTRLSGESELTLCVSLHDRALAKRHLPRLIGIRAGQVFKDAPSGAWSDADFEALYHLDSSALVDA